MGARRGDGDVRFKDELQYSVYNSELMNVDRLWRLLGEHEAECKELLAAYTDYPNRSASWCSRPTTT